MDYGMISIRVLYWKCGKPAKYLFKWEGQYNLDVSWEFLKAGRWPQVRCRRIPPIPGDVIGIGPFQVIVLDNDVLSENATCWRIGGWREITGIWFYKLMWRLFGLFWVLCGWADAE